MGKRGGRDVAVVDVFNWLVALEGNFDGVTISGGEPFQQYGQLISFLYLVKERTAFDVYCFSGYYLGELEELFPDRLFYRYIDYLIDGRYVGEFHENSNVKGSSNQTLYRFIDGAAVRQEIIPSNKWSVSISRDNRIYMAGIPKEKDLDQLCAKLAEVGISKEFK